MTTLIIQCHYAESRYNEGQYVQYSYAQCHYAESHDVESRGALILLLNIGLAWKKQWAYKYKYNVNFSEAPIANKKMFYNFDNRATSMNTPTWHSG